MDSEDFQAILRSFEEALFIQNDDVVPKTETNHLADQVPSTCSNTWPSNYNSEYHMSLNSDLPNNISCTIPAMDHQNQLIPHSNVPMHHQSEGVTETPIEEVNCAHHEYFYHQTNPMDHHNQIPHSDVPIHHQSEAVMEAPVQVVSHAQECFYHQIDPIDQNQIPNSTTQHYTIPSRSILPKPSIHQFDTQSLSNVPMNQPQPLNNDQFNFQIPYDFPVHRSPPIDEFNPQVPSDIPLQMQLSMNQFNLQNITQLTPSMPSGLVNQQPHHMSPRMTMFPKFPSSGPFHATHSTPQNHIVHQVPPIHQWNRQNPSNGIQYNPHPLTSPEFSSDPWLSDRQHLGNQLSFNSEAPINIDQTDTKGKLWSKEEHKKFLMGLRIYGKGKWKEISQHMKTRTSIQIGSHAQKFFERQNREGNKKRKRKSINDITDPYAFP